MLRKIEDVTLGTIFIQKAPYNMEQKINELRNTNLKINDITSFLLNRISNHGKN